MHTSGGGGGVSVIYASKGFPVNRRGGSAHQRAASFAFCLIFSFLLTTDRWQRLQKHPECKRVTHSFIFFPLAASCGGVI